VTDAEVREVYQFLIEKSWEKPDTFEEYQRAWEAVAKELGIVEIEDNGHGRVLRVEKPQR
jgi:hypothetical protein